MHREKKARVDIWYVLERLDDIKTQKDLDEFKAELREVRDEALKDTPFQTTVDHYEKDLSGIARQVEEFDVHTAIKNVKADYIKRAMDASKGSPTRAARLLGLKNHQTLRNWLKGTLK